MYSDTKVFLFHASEALHLEKGHGKQYNKADNILHLCSLLSHVEVNAL